MSVFDFEEAFKSDWDARAEATRLEKLAEIEETAFGDGGCVTELLKEFVTTCKTGQNSLFPHKFPETAFGNPYFAACVLFAQGEQIERYESSVFAASWVEELPSLKDVSSFPTTFRAPEELNMALIKHFAWAIPNAKALEAIKTFSLGKVVEMGAGKGYWAHLLQQQGCAVAAYDQNPGHWLSMEYENKWYDVQTGSAEVLRAYPDHALFLCYPPRFEGFNPGYFPQNHLDKESTMAADSLMAYLQAGGRRVIYVGEHPDFLRPEKGAYGYGTASWTFFQMLKELKLEKTVDLPRWWGRDDKLFLYSSCT